MLIPLKDTSSVEGTKTVLETKISAQDISSVKWFHNEQLLKPSDRIQMVTKGAKQRLVLNRTYATDEGHYKLVVGRTDTSCRLSVQSELTHHHKTKYFLQFEIFCLKTGSFKPENPSFQCLLSKCVYHNLQSSFNSSLSKKPKNCSDQSRHSV